MNDDSNVPVTPEDSAEGRAPVQSAFAGPSKKHPLSLLVALIVAGMVVVLAIVAVLAYS